MFAKGGYKTDTKSYITAHTYPLLLVNGQHTKFQLNSSSVIWLYIMLTNNN